VPRLEVLEDRSLPSTLTVSNNLDSGPGSLRAQIAAASSGDTIVFASVLKNQTITLASELVINKSLDIEGLGARKLTVSGNDASRVFDIVTIANMTITHGFAVQGAGIDNSVDSPLLGRENVARFYHTLTAEYLIGAMDALEDQVLFRGEFP
jgi:hypothetical protein